MALRRLPLAGFPPLDPMMIIDRGGEVHHLPYGRKEADALLRELEPYLAE